MVRARARASSKHRPGGRPTSWATRSGPSGCGDRSWSAIPSGAVALALGMSRPEEIAGILALAPICFPELRLEQVLFGPRAVPVAGDALAHSAGAAVDSALLPLLWRVMFLP